MKNQVSIKPALATASAVSGDILQKSKALSAQLSKAQPTIVKPATVSTTVAPVATEVKLRPDVIEFGKRAQLKPKPIDAQTPYEKRYYMRMFHCEHPKSDEVTHLTSHTVAMLRDKVLAALQDMYSKRSPGDRKEIFSARDLTDYFDIYGPAKGDVPMAALLEQVKAKTVEHITEVHGRKTRHYFKLLQLVPAMPAAPAKAQ